MKPRILEPIATVSPFLVALMLLVKNEAGVQSSAASSPSDIHREALVVDGHVHITNAVFNQGINPWKVQATGTFDFARARQGGLDVAIEQIYIEDAYTHYNYTIKQACRLIEVYYRVLDANQDKMALARSPPMFATSCARASWQSFWL